MKLFKSIHDFGYEWSLVTAANWKKYPNENCPHVRHVDVLNRTVDPETGVLTTERLITVEQNVPRLILKLLSTKETQYVREISIVDPRQKMLTMNSVNLTMSNLLTIEEHTTYYQHPDHREQTQMSQQATVSAGCLLSRWSNTVEDFCLNRFKQNAAVGREGFIKVLERFVAMAESGQSP
ncbi:protein MSF1 [Spinellus fusiger]|nr:protein MSF1 [Spinellus fusiger]